MTKYKFKDENGNWKPLVQDVKVNGTSVFNGTDANITIQQPDVTKQYVDTQLATKQDTLVSGENIKTINNINLLGEGNINFDGIESAVIPYDIIYYDPKGGGAAQFFELIGGAENLEKIKHVMKNKGLILVGNNGDDYFGTVAYYINESKDPYWFNMEVVFWQKTEQTFYTFNISGGRTSNFSVNTSRMASLLGQISLRQYWELDGLDVPEGTTAYVATGSLEGTLSFNQFAIGETINTLSPLNYPIGDDSLLQTLTAQDLTSKVIMEQENCTLTISFRPEPIANEINVYDWNVVTTLSGEEIVNKHLIYVGSTYSGSTYEQGWNLYDALTGTITQVSYYDDTELFRFYNFVKKEVDATTYSQYDVTNLIETAVSHFPGSYRYKDVDYGEYSGIEWALEHPNVQADFLETNPKAPAFIKNKDFIGTVKSVNNITPVDGNVTLSIPTVNDSTITFTQGGVTKGTITLNQSSDATIDFDTGGGSSLPSQTGHSGEFLTTDGTDASWGIATKVTIREWS